ncbi:SulP family inorganic anion transporter [Marinomonas dokdonensis]|uniref:SulP family inorganic anion transporter n=1 Tax=Marinomonas dokdonensis TaxID=328224 RepID=UPI0040559017
MITRFFPFLIWFRTLTVADIKADFMAGITGAVIVLPQGVAFATIAGLPPQYGLYTAMVTPVIAALFGSSRHLISGPTTAISIVVFSSVSGYSEPGSAEFISMALTLTFMAGVYQLAFGLVKLGKMVDFVSHTVVIGFTAGAAILIATSQIKHMTGLSIERGASFIETWSVSVQNIHELNLAILSVALCTLLIAIFFKVKYPALPGLLIAMVIGSLVAMFAGEDKGIELVGEIPGSLPPLSLPDFSIKTLHQLLPEALAVAILGLIEAVSIGRAIGVKSQQRIDPNQEFIGQGLSNIFGSFFSCYAGSGSFTRSGVNYTAGAKSGLSAVFAAILLMFLVVLVAPLTAYLPVSAMAGVIILVAYNLVDFSHIKKILITSRSESLVLLVTLLSTLFFELEYAIYFGVFVSLILFLLKTSVPEVTEMTLDASNFLFTEIDSEDSKDKEVQFLRIDMSIYFGSVGHIQSKLEAVTALPKTKRIIILCGGINSIDLSGIELLASINHKLMTKGGGLYFFGMKPLVKNQALKLGVKEHLGEHSILNCRQELLNVLSIEKQDLP